MVFPEPLPDVPPVEAGGARRPETPGRLVRNELLRRHLLARIGAAREELRQLEEHGTAPRGLVVRFSATVADAQRAIAEQRSAARAETADLLRRADERAAELLAAADAEARVLRATTTWLRHVPLGGGSGALAGPWAEPTGTARS